MNFLAHAYLSFNHPEILLGNMISDFVKGRKKFDYPIWIQKGIQLHRDIDHFTDSHLMTKRAKKVFCKDYGLYSGAFVDICYDHFLALDQNIFNEKSLAEFTKQTYASIEHYIEWQPPKFGMLFPYMKKDDWLFNYQFTWGIEKSFGGLVRRAAYMYEHQTAFRLFEENMEELQYCYSHFFPDLKTFSEQQFELLIEL